MSEHPRRPTKEEILETLRRIRASIRVTKITCTRTQKSRNGDSFVGFSAAYQVFGEDANTHVASDGSECPGVSLSDAKLARYVLSMECDVGALESALANGGITQEYFRDAVRGVRNNYNQLILREMGVISNDDHD